MRRWIWTIVALLIPSLSALAHEGEVHEDPATKAPPPLPGAGLRALSAVTENFEVVIKHPPLDPGREGALTLFLSDYRTNAPVAGAQIRVDISDAGLPDLRAEPMDSPGIYRVVLKAPKQGTYSLVLDVMAGDLSDLIPIEGLTAGLPEAEADHSRPLFWWISGVVIFLALAGWILWRRRPASRVLVGALITGSLLWPASSRAHEGESHGEDLPTATQPAVAGQTLTVPKEAQFLLGIRTDFARKKMLSRRVRALGRFMPRPGGQADVSPVQPGRVVLDAKHPIAGIGDRVSAGQTLAVLEQLPTDQATLEAAFNEAQKTLEHARQDYDRLVSLDKIVSQKDLQHAGVELKIAQAEFDRLSNQMSLYHRASDEGRTVNRLYVRAPIAGVVVETHVSVGEQVEVNNSLFRIVDLDPLRAEADVYETDLPALRNAGRAIIISRAYPGETFSGDLVNVGGIVDEATRTTKAIFSVANPDARLKAGMFAEVSIDVGIPEEVLTVPKAAVIEAGGKRLVFVHTQPETFVAREVSIAQTDGEDVAIQSGVAEGERIVVTGGYQLWSQSLRQ